MLVSVVLGSTAESKRISRYFLEINKVRLKMFATECDASEIPCWNLVGGGSSASLLADLRASLRKLPQVLLDLFQIDGMRLLVGSTQHHFQRVLTTSAAHLSVISFESDAFQAS